MIKYAIKISKYTAICTIILSSYSCESFIEVELPPTHLAAETVFADAATANAALSSIYSKMRDDVLFHGSSSGISALLANYADELDYYSSAGLEVQDFNQNNLTATNGTVATIWNGTYNLIYASNAVIEGVSNATNISMKDQNRILGEAYFLRAFLHFQLLNLFGEIPYVTTTNYQINNKISKVQLAEGYSLIENDLMQAIELLPQEYASAQRTRPNNASACAFMARVKLYNHEWQQAIQYADLVINNTVLYTWVEDLNKVFLNQSPGTLWQFAPQTQGNNTLEAQTFIFTTAPPPLFALRPDLVAQFETADNRRTEWIGTVTDGNQSWYFANKYKENSNSGSTVECSIIFRVDEQYLIRAEALTQLDNLSAANEALNKTRNRAGLANSTLNTQEALLKAIAEERRKEFFTEWGHRWFDLRRTGKTSELLAKKPGWDINDVLWPLPENELMLNPNLEPQNPGY